MPRGWCRCRGPTVICRICNWLAERTPARLLDQFRAFENSCYVIESSHWGLERTVQFSGAVASFHRMARSRP